MLRKVLIAFALVSLAMTLRIQTVSAQIQTVYRYAYIGMQLKELARDQSWPVPENEINIKYQVVYVGQFHNALNTGNLPIAVCESATCYMAIFSYLLDPNSNNFPSDSSSILKATYIHYADFDITPVSAFSYSTFALMGNLEGLMTQNVVRYFFIIPVALLMAYRITRFVVQLARRNKEDVEEYFDEGPFTMAEARTLGITNKSDPEDGYSHE